MSVLFFALSSFMLFVDLSTSASALGAYIVEDALSLWDKPNVVNEQQWLLKHPIQPERGDVQFNMTKVYKRKVGNQAIRREWISYNTNTKKWYCYICLAYSSNHYSPFVNKGLSTTDTKHLYCRISEHELTNTHDNSVQAYIMAKTNLNLPSHLEIAMKKLHDDMVQNNWHIMQCVVQAKKGHSYRVLLTLKQYTIWVRTEIMSLSSG